MIGKRKSRIIRQNTLKTKKNSQLQGEKPVFKSKRYSKKYLKKRNSIRKQILEKANTEFQIELEYLNEKSRISDNQMILEEPKELHKKTDKILTIDENPTYITIKNERFSARNVILPLKNFTNFENYTIKSILRKYE